MTMDGNDAARLARIAEQAMRERGFLAHPTPEAIAEAAGAREPDGQLDGVRDLRALPWTSIDNPESQDLDQIEAAEAADGGTRLYVGIADVDHFVRAGSAIDRAAGTNTTSVYTGVRTFPMLPERLSFDLSSLLQARRRPALVIETLIAADGSIVAKESKMYPALVENRAKLDYPSVSAWLDGHAPAPAPLANEPALRAQVELHDRVSRVLGEARRRDGALDLDTGEVRPTVDERGRVTGLQAHHQDRAGRIIEELMIASNRAVAHALDGAGLPSIRRVVKEPERWARIVAYASDRGVKLPASPNPRAMAGFVDQMRRTHAAQFSEISLALVKMMGRGEYVAHAPHAPEIGHFGLATDEYTHATAPNRRYPDLITQRLLKSLAGKRAPYSFERLQEIAAHCTRMEAEAQKVERRVHKSAAAALLESRRGEVFDGVVTGASDKGTFVRVLEPPVEGKVVRGGRGLEVGDAVRVKLLDVSVEKGFIDFEALGQRGRASS
ncbi:MAG TPA: RNB domain-containing ribonuclease [Polyangia bacterium]|nr:RNB domain-containing ribonuclease [Polyangia bacterium]